MEKFTKKYKDFVYESLDDKFKDKIGSEYQSLKRNLLTILDNSVEKSDELVNVQNFISKYLDDPKNATMVGFVDDGDIFSLYMKCQGDVDEICTQNNYFDKSPKENNIYSLYAFIISGTKYAVKKCLELLEKDLFKE